MKKAILVIAMAIGLLSFTDEKGTQEKPKEKVLKFDISYSASVEQTNQLLDVLKKAPYEITAPLIEQILSQGYKQLQDTTKKIAPIDSTKRK